MLVKPVGKPIRRLLQAVLELNLLHRCFERILNGVIRILDELRNDAASGRQRYLCRSTARAMLASWRGSTVLSITPDRNFGKNCLPELVFLFVVDDVPFPKRGGALCRLEHVIWP